MAGKNRDLTVNIDGEAKGVDRAFASAKASAEVFERELEKLERQQKLQEESLKRAEAATKSFGRSQSDAAEKATRLGHAAAEAGDKAARSSAMAKEEAEKLAKGEGDAERAALLEAKALRDVEKAAIATAAAQRAAAKAAEDEARQEKQAARDAVVAAGTQRLEHLRAGGAVKEHNQLLTKLRKDYTEFDDGFKEMRTLGEQAFGGLKTAMSGVASGAASMAQNLGPGMVAIILGALAVLPAAATLLGGGIVLGLGGAFAAMGLDATKGSAVAQHALTGLKDYARGVIGDITKPFEQTWVSIADGAKTALGGLAPDLKSLFGSLAPEVSAFVNQFSHEIPGQLHGFLTSLKADFGPISAELGSTLPQALGLAADGLKQIMDQIAKDPQAFGNMINATGRFVQALGTMVVWLIKVGSFLAKVNAMTGSVGSGFQRAGAKLGFFGQPLSMLGGLMKRFDLSTSSAGNTLVGFAGNLATSAAQAGAAATATGKLTQQTNQLDMAIQKILDPSLALSNDTIAMKEAQVALAAALKTSHGQMGLQTAQSRASTQAFNALIKSVATTATDQKNLDGNMKRASATVQTQIQTLWRLAGSNKDAQAQVIRLAQAFNVPLPASARRAKGAVDGLHTAMDGIKSKRVTVTADVSQAYNAAAGLQRYINSIFGHAYGGPVGHVPGMASGGPVQRYPGGGAVHGAGSSTSDSIPTMLSNGEFVVNARQTAQWLPELIAINKGMAKTAMLPAARRDMLRAVPLSDATSGFRMNGVHVSRLPAGRTATLPAAAPAVLHAGATGGGRLDVYIHVDGPRHGLMGEIVKNLKTEVRTLGGGSAQTFFGQN